MEASSSQFGDAAEDAMLNVYRKKKEEQSSIDGAQSPDSARHALQTSPATAAPTSALEHIKLGSFYEIDHSALSHGTSEQLKIARVVMVSEKNDTNVSVRYPSFSSVQSHFENHSELNGKKLPPLREKCVMGTYVAEEVLYRRIPAQELAEKRNCWDFWVLPSVPAEEVSGRAVGNAIFKKGSCWSEIMLTGMVKWGQRRRVRFLGRHEDQNTRALSSPTKNEEGGRTKGGSDDEEEKEPENNEEDFSNLPAIKRRKVRIKHHGLSNFQKRKRVEPEVQNQIQVHNHNKRKELKKTVERWSMERYKLAEENMYKILKAKGAVFGNPILRPALRTEARKLIGDTGLLDHLLKHMAGKVAPGGTDRFRRRHNADGAMEYWLESADLVNIRREAGVQDAYWTPPPGWKPGDNPTQDPVCAREIKQLKLEVAKMKREMQELASWKQEHSALKITQNPTTISACEASPLALKDVFPELLNLKAKIEEKLMEISKSLSETQEQNISDLEEPPALSMASPLTTPPSDEENQKDQEAKTETYQGEEKGEDKGSRTEDKAAKIQRLKSGFRICKPPGTFLWPNMAASPQVVVHPDEPLPVPTPPSASSATSMAHLSSPSHPQPCSPVKPLARRPFSRASSYSPSFVVPPKITKAHSGVTNETSLINLNEAPSASENYRHSFQWASLQPDKTSERATFGRCEWGRSI